MGGIFSNTIKPHQIQIRTHMLGKLCRIVGKSEITEAKLVLFSSSVILVYYNFLSVSVSNENILLGIAEIRKLGDFDTMKCDTTKNTNDQVIKQGVSKTTD